MKSAAATIRMMLDTKQMSTGLQQLNREMTSLSGSAAKFTGALGVGLSATAILADATNVVMEYSSANSRLAAVLGTTRDATQALQEQQQALGASTMFTAAQVADAQTELAKLGFTQQEIADSTSGVLSLAAASNIDLARAAEIAGGVLRGFGMRASESGRVVDVMAASFTKSALDAEKFAESMKYVAPVAAAAGIDVETTTALLGKLADSMISGSLGGTALKNLLSVLSDENSDLAKEVGFGVKNSDDLIRAFDILATKNIDLSKATQLTDERSKAAFLTLISNTDALKKLTRELENSDGAADKLADTMQDNLKGDLTTLRSAWEGFILSLNKGQGEFSNVARGITQMTTSLTGFLTKLNQGKGWAKALGLDTSEEMIAEFVENNKKATNEMITNFEKTLKVGHNSDQLYYTQLLNDLDMQILANPKEKKALEERRKAVVEFYKEYKSNSDKIVKVEEGVTEVTEAELKKQTEARKKAFDQMVEDANVAAIAMQGANRTFETMSASAGISALQQAFEGGVISAQALNYELVKTTQNSAGLVYSMQEITDVFNEWQDPVMFENFKANLDDITKKNNAMALQLAMTNEVINTFGMDLRNVLAEGMQDFDNFGEALGNMLKRMIAQLGAAAGAAAVLSFILNSMGLGGANTSFKALFGQMSGLGGLMGGVPKLASGGIVNGPTLAMIGEGGASEAVIPLNKLQGMMGGSSVGYIRGTDIVYSSERAGQFLKRVGR